MKKRSIQKEIMDLGPAYYTEVEYEECLKKLFLVGKYSGIHRDTFKLLKRLNPKSILDVGCGDGAFLAEIAKRMPHALCRGIDISRDAIRYAAVHRLQNATFACTDSLVEADVIMANLVCHHMTDSELCTFLEKAYHHARHAVIINDLQRHVAAKYLFSLISAPLFSNRLISHDGLISIERGFCKNELEEHMERLAPHSYEIAWRFPFRWQVLLWKR